MMKDTLRGKVLSIKLSVKKIKRRQPLTKLVTLLVRVIEALGVEISVVFFSLIEILAFTQYEFGQNKHPVTKNNFLCIFYTL